MRFKTNRGILFKCRMKAIFWNVRGFNKPTKQDLKDPMKTFILDLVGLIEHKLKGMVRLERVIKNIWKGANCINNVECTSKGRICIVWHQTRKEIYAINMSDQCFTFWCKEFASNSKVMSLVIYATQLCYR